MAKVNTDLLGLLIISLEDASVVGEVDDLIIDEGSMKLAGFLANLGLYEADVLPFEKVTAIGDDAIMIGSESDLIKVSADPRLERLLEKEIEIVDTEAITISGCSVGTIGEYYVDTDNGSILGVKFVSDDQSVYPREEAVIPSESIHRVGKAMVVLADDYDQHLFKDPSSLDKVAKRRPGRSRAAARDAAEEAAEPESVTPESVTPESVTPESERSAAATIPAPEEVAAEEVPSVNATSETPVAAEVVDEVPLEAEEVSVAVEEEVAEEEVAGTILSDESGTRPSQAADTLADQQRHFLLGKKVLRRIEGPSGEVLADEGQEVTPEMIQRAKEQDLLLILSLNVE